MNHQLTRRSLLAALLGTTAAAALGFRGAAEERPLRHPQDGAAVVGFAGPTLVQLLVEDTVFNAPPAVAVGQGDEVAWAPDPNDRFGGHGQLNGVGGNFSGDRHATAAQLFFEWASIEEGSEVPTFHLTAQDGAGRTGAEDPANWQVRIDGEPATVRAVWRKTVPTHSEWLDRATKRHARRHLITLDLEQEVPERAELRITIPSWGDVEARRGNRTVSEAVHVCHLGYPTSGTKKGYVGLWLGHDASGTPGTTDDTLAEGTRWGLFAEGAEEPAATGELRLAKPADEEHRDGVNFNGCDIYEADFSEVREEGTYTLVVEGVGASVPFLVTANPYAELFRLTARWFFHQRSGCAIEEPFGEGHTRPRNGHPEDGLTVWRTNIRLGRTSEGFQREPYALALMGRQPTGLIGDGPGAPHPEAWGGWHDAGDWDRRIRHMLPIYEMAAIIERFPSARRLDMNIPESGKTFADAAVQARRDPEDTGDGETVLPDLIHEALWGISLWRRTQGPDGSIIGGVEYSLDGIQGSVSWNPVQETYSYAPEEWSAYEFARAAAKLGHVIRTVCGDEVLGSRLVDEAEAAWQWAERQLESGGHRGEDNVDMERTESAIKSSRIAAAATLFRASGNPDAKALFEDHNPFVPRIEGGDAGLQRAHPTGAWHDYVSAGGEGREADPEIADAIASWLRSRPNWEERMGRDYGLHNSPTYPWSVGWLRFGPGSNWRASHVAHIYALDDGEISPELQEIVLEGMWFPLGCNPSNVSFVQGMGKRDFAEALVIDLKRQPPIPGLPCFGVAGGELRPFERDRIVGSLFPAEQTDWPIYAQIFETSSVIICSEHGLGGNLLEWLGACAMANELLS